MQLLERAKAWGDLLIVGVNTDSSVAALKGEDRPINRLWDRMAVLRAIRFVDCVLPFDELTPENLVRGIRPDFIVKGPGYRMENTPEARIAEAWGCKLIVLDGPDVSSTKILERLRA